MMFNHAYKKTNDSDFFLIKPKTIYTFLANQLEQPSLIRRLNRQLGYFPSLLAKDTTFIDYLTIRENMLIILSLAPNQTKRRLDLVVNEVLEELQIPDSLANQPFSALPLTLSIQLQLTLTILCNKKVILVDNWLSHESASNKQDWLFLFREFSRTHGCSFIIFTSDEKLLPIENLLRMDSVSYSSKKIS